MDNPLKPVPQPDELLYNYWLLSRLYIHADTELRPIDQYDGISALYAGLSDPYTRYVEPQKADEQRHRDTSTAVSGGVGVELAWVIREDSLRLQIHRVYPYSPAENAGLRKGDRLLSVNGLILNHDSAYVVFRRERQAVQRLELVVLRGADTVTVDLLQGMVYVPTVFSDTLDGVEVIQIREFSRNTLPGQSTSDELRVMLERDTSSAVRILDVRGNPGGEIGVCLNAADEFVADGKPLLHLVVRGFDGRGRQKIDTAHFMAHGGGAGERGAFLILIDSTSASCAEIFAAAVRENRPDVRFVGTRSYGKGIGQSHWNTPAGGLASITNLEIRTPLWNNYHGRGLPVDVPVDSGDILHKALELSGSVTARRAPLIVTRNTEHLYFLDYSRDVHMSGSWISGESWP